MKRFLLACMVIVTMCATGWAKSAILVAHYGSSDDDTRSRTINLITEEIRQAFPAFEVREAYISPIVRKSLAKRGIDILSPVDALLRLRADGYDSVYVQSTTLIDGSEMAEVRHSVELTAPFFKHIVTGRPLLYSPDDCREVTEILLREPCDKNEAVIYVGHGNMLPSTATYAQLDDMIYTAADAGTYHVSTIEGYPTAASTVKQLDKEYLSGKKTKAGKNKGVKVKLVPLLLVCGNHTKRDIAGDFADTMREAGYTPEVVMRGLGENPAIRAIYENRIKEML